MSDTAKEMILVLDFGGQYNQLIARRVRECNVYCEVHPHTLSLEKIREMAPKGIIFTGGPNSVYEKDSALCSKELLEIGVPVLGICYGSQLMAHILGGEVKTAPVSEYGKTEVTVEDTSSLIFKGVEKKTVCWMSHTDYIFRVPMDSMSLHLLRSARQQRWRMPRGNFMRRSSIRRSCTRWKAKRCSTISSLRSADAPEAGGWIPLWCLP